jgi:hypothetical protein
MLVCSSLENDVAESLGRWAITKDSCPQMRRIVWSLDGDYLAYADSLGNVTIYDLIGTVHCHLPSVRICDKYVFMPKYTI